MLYARASVLFIYCTAHTAEGGYPEGIPVRCRSNVECQNPGYPSHVATLSSLLLDRVATDATTHGGGSETGR